MIDEEKVFLQEFSTQNMTEKNLQMADKILDEKLRRSASYKNDAKILVGEPYY